MSQRVEVLLLKALQKSGNLKVKAVKVLAIRKGSIVVDAEVFIDDQQTTQKEIQDTITDAAKNNELDSLTPEPNFQVNVTGTFMISSIYIPR